MDTSITDHNLQHNL